MPLTTSITCPFCKTEDVQVEYDEGEPSTYDYPGCGPSAYPIGDACCNEAAECPEALGDLAMAKYDEILDMEAEAHALAGLEELPF